MAVPLDHTTGSNVQLDPTTILNVFGQFDTDTSDFENRCLIYVYGILAILGLAANFLFCCVVVRNEKLHTVTHMLMTNLAMSNLLFLMFHPSYVITTYLLQRSFVFGTLVCKVSFSVAYITSSASFYFMGFVAIDRWLAIFRRKCRLNRRTCCFLVIAAWSISFCIAAPYMLSAHVVDMYDIETVVQEHMNRRKTNFELDLDTADLIDLVNSTNFNLSSNYLGELPNIESQISTTHWYRCTSDTASNSVLIATVLLQYALPLGITIPTYGHLMHFVWKRAPIGVQTRERRERAYRRRRKLLLTLSAIVLVLIVCWLPLFIVNILKSRNMIHNTAYVRAYKYCSIVTVAGVVITPIFYLANDGCREQVVRLFCCRTVPASERERQALMSTNPYPERSCEVMWYQDRENGTSTIVLHHSNSSTPEGSKHKAWCTI